MFPDRCTLYISAVEDKTRTHNHSFWRNVYDFDMSAIYTVVNTEPGLAHIRQNKIISDACPIKIINFYNITTDEWQKFEIVFCLNIERDSVQFAALFTFVEIEFTKCHRPIKISSRPGSKLSNWIPTLFQLNSDEISQLHLYNGDEVYGSLMFNAENKRKAKIRIDLCYRNRSGFLRDFFHFQFR